MGRGEGDEKGMGEAMAVWRDRAEYGGQAMEKLRIEGTGGSIKQNFSRQRCFASRRKVTRSESTRLCTKKNCFLLFEGR